MPLDTTPTPEEVDKLVYHHVVCDEMAEIQIRLTEKGQARKNRFTVLGISSKESIDRGLRAVDASPFQTVFVVDEITGTVLFALSKNDAYVAEAKKKRPKPKPEPVPDPVSYACRRCQQRGGVCGEEYPDGSIICYGADSSGGSGGGLSDPLETLGG